MQSRNPMLDDLARVASGAMTTLGGVREEVENRVRERMERLAAELELVTREEHEAVRAMAQKAREEQEALLERLAALEARLVELEGSGDGAGEDKPAPRRRAAPKKATDADGEPG